MSVEDIEGKVFLVTGGANGIGARVVRSLLDSGAKHVVVLDIDAENGQSLQEDILKENGADKMKFYPCDVTDEEMVNKAFDEILTEHGYIDTVINNAALMNDSEGVFRMEIKLNVGAVITTSVKAYKLMSVQEGGKGGTIVNISSVAAMTTILPCPIYNASKSAVLLFGSTLGKQSIYERSKVRVLTICFGPTDTSLLNKVGCIDKGMEEEYAAVDKMTKRQKEESAARGLIEAYRNGKSGSTWVVANDQPAQDVTSNITKGLETMLSNLTFH